MNLAQGAVGRGGACGPASRAAPPILQRNRWPLPRLSADELHQLRPGSPSQPSSRFVASRPLLRPPGSDEPARRRSQRGMRTPAFERGRYVVDPDGSGLSEHAVHHFHGLVLEAYRRAGAP